MGRQRKGFLKETKMIAIAFDMHRDNTFCGESFSFITVDNPAHTWADYKEQADMLIKEHSLEKTVVVKVNNADFSINKFSVALFVSSFEAADKPDLVVFKVDDLERAREAYKPYLALTVALKYVLQLFNQPPEVICRNVSILGYLGLLIETDYVNNVMLLEYSGNFGAVYEFEAHDSFEVLLWAAVLKTVSLAQIPTKIRVRVFLGFKPQKIDANKLMEQIIQKVSFWIK